MAVRAYDGDVPAEALKAKKFGSIQLEFADIPSSVRQETFSINLPVSSSQTSAHGFP